MAQKEFRKPPRYMVGDIVYSHGFICIVCSIYPFNIDYSYDLKVIDGQSLGKICQNDIMHVHIWEEFLKKNGWNKSIGWSYVGSGKRGYQFSKELDDKWVELDRMTYGDLQICQCENLRDWSYINECNHYFRFEFTYVHELQHLLYAFHIDSNLKI